VGAGEPHQSQEANYRRLAEHWKAVNQEGDPAADDRRFYQIKHTTALSLDEIQTKNKPVLCQILEARNRQGKGKLRVPKEAGLDPIPL
jgi:hypothetical protein